MLPKSDPGGRSCGIPELQEGSAVEGSISPAFYEACSKPGKSTWPMANGGGVVSKLGRKLPAYIATVQGNGNLLVGKATLASRPQAR